MSFLISFSDARGLCKSELIKCLGHSSHCISSKRINEQSFWCLNFQLWKEGRNCTLGRNVFSHPGRSPRPVVYFHPEMKEIWAKGPPFGICSWKSGWSWFPEVFVWHGQLCSGWRKREGHPPQLGVPVPLSSLAAETKKQFYANQCTWNEDFFFFYKFYFFCLETE